ncbi:MAG: hypothetical protein CHACPFDD_00169 [Phycisphaerae bacterium]|nr:hypothetical protein [Phycisphaerae bacterium]
MHRRTRFRVYGAGRHRPTLPIGSRRVFRAGCTQTVYRRRAVRREVRRRAAPGLRRGWVRIRCPTSGEASEPLTRVRGGRQVRRAAQGTSPGRGKAGSACSRTTSSPYGPRLASGVRIPRLASGVGSDQVSDERRSIRTPHASEGWEAGQACRARNVARAREGRGVRARVRRPRRTAPDWRRGFGFPGLRRGLAGRPTAICPAVAQLRHAAQPLRPASASPNFDAHLKAGRSI